tara:strand:- start:104 stop:628 length:525 start_codon:yes stop_codon:yes gene_type:complete
MKKVILLLPLILLTVVCLFFFLFILFKKDPNDPPSALLNKDLPIFSTTSLYNKDENFSSENIKGEYILINFFASWCTPCRAEHHLFFEIKKDKPNLFILGIAHKDDPDDSQKYLSEEGNPYTFVGLDQDGKVALEFGVFGLPETFIINREGKIIFKHTGPLTKEIINDEIKALF